VSSFLQSSVIDLWHAKQGCKIGAAAAAAGGSRIPEETHVNIKGRN